MMEAATNFGRRATVDRAVGVRRMLLRLRLVLVREQGSVILGGYCSLVTRSKPGVVGVTVRNKVGLKSGYSDYVPRNDVLELCEMIFSMLHGSLYEIPLAVVHRLQCISV
jgi:hypothetical protein